MERRLANVWRLTVNDKNFIKSALFSDIRIDGRKPYEYRKIAIKFGRQVLASFINLVITLFHAVVLKLLILKLVCTCKDICIIEDGSSEVQLGQTRVMGITAAQLVQPYRDRPKEGVLSIFMEFSPMADPSFEPGRPGELAVELGRIIDRGLRESRAVDTESLCVLAGKFVWAIHIALHILDNGGYYCNLSMILFC
ncbi:hypothetical protein CRYUN_Cryun25bG0058400 [Craigia yunnanensis]